MGDQRMTRIPSNNGDWLLFLSLERDFVSTIDYVAISPKHDNVFSIAYLKILLLACSAVERLAKKYCREKGASLAEKPSIYDVRRAIVQANPDFPTLYCYAPRIDEWSREPWAETEWAGEGKPWWWADYNAAKHNELERASQRSVIDSLAALFCLNLAYYEEDIRANRLASAPVFFDSEFLVQLMATSGARSPYAAKH